ncbi:MAG: carbohydrate kinase family protein [Spirochaetia bacterium]
MVRISVTGSALIDYLYGSVDFAGDAFVRYHSKQPGDGGLQIGGLVLAEDLEAYGGWPLPEILAEIVGPIEPDMSNVGGPAVVAGIHAAQVGVHDDIQVTFEGARGDDPAGAILAERIASTPLSAPKFHVFEGETPATIVLSDPGYAAGTGERSFITRTGAAGGFEPRHLSADFYKADIALFGGTALVPRLHAGLDECLETARNNKVMTIVGTVYDFPNERKAPGSPWPLGRHTATWQYIDLLVTDREEALKISGCDTVDEAIDRFLGNGIGTAVVTQGADDVVAESRKPPFAPSGRIRLPVSERIVSDQAKGTGPFGNHAGDTTGCGDNFVGGLMHAIATQFNAGVTSGIDLRAALAPAVVSGGFAGFYLGGYFEESGATQKAKSMESYISEYRAQIGLSTP